MYFNSFGFCFFDDFTFNNNVCTWSLIMIYMVWYANENADKRTFFWHDYWTLYSPTKYLQEEE